ncbi:hypothetical protein M427DRAFT_50989 [Gonapodya prolifera JEL478]|uniref:ZZ-type domain-containing protein n=1 Tax=Gonapodya prolifera (strain JEL478) TaxID=1344416 RepID=A0A139AXY2_GONPJ|nr:hypothetical protein M427DRAFT_50989 [Gonapodya prolifera JEL478]|eukprot:KXS21564.1 hypothetical protein M427DRAFT_50989 [Gonapodya prolifera JEL478]
MSSSIGFKVSYNGVTRFVNNPTTWEELVDRIRTSHAIPSDHQVSVTYVDEDGDKITIDTNSEFQELTSYAQRATASSGSRAFRVEVVTSAPGDTASQTSREATDAFTLVVEGARQGVERMTVSDSAAEAEAARAAAAEAVKKAEAEAEAARRQAEADAEAARIQAEEAARKAAAEAEAARLAAEAQAEAARLAAEEEAYQAFLANLQPQVDTVLSIIESAPATYIPRLIRDLGPSLAQRSWGLTVEGPLGELLGTSRGRGCGAGQEEGNEHRHGHGRHGGRWWRRMADPEEEKRWRGVACDGCGKRDWIGTRWRCQNCPDYDHCDTCNAKKEELHDVTHEFVGIERPDEMWSTVTCDGCSKNGVVERFKCQSCPNYDLCSSCHVNASAIHPDHSFTAMGTPASSTAPNLAQIAAVLDFESSPADRRARQEKVARHLLRRYQGDLQRVIEEMLKGRQRWGRHHHDRDTGNSSPSSDEADPMGPPPPGPGFGPEFWWSGPQRRGRYHGPGASHPYRHPHPHGPWGPHHPPPPPPPPGAPGPAGPEGMAPPPWGGPGAGPFGWWGGRGWF